MLTMRLASQRKPDEPDHAGWRCNATDEERFRNCALAKRAGFPILVGAKKVEITTPCVIVGTGFSAKQLLPEIRQRYDAGEEIVAIKGAHDWLIDNGIIPHVAVAIDAQQRNAKCFRRPHKDVQYLCASQMHPETWLHLKGYDVIVWHAMISKAQLSMPEWANTFIVLSASTTGNSAILLMNALGRRNVHLYGLDSSIPAPHWWNRWLRPALKLDGTKVREGAEVYEVRVGDRRYWTTPEMSLQAQEYRLMRPYIKHMKVTAHGDGYYQAIVKGAA